MILKKRDTAWRKLAIMELELLLDSQLTQKHQSDIEKELRIFKAGDRSERDTTYYLDTHLKETKNWVVLHDLRLEDGDEVAQIDHLVISRGLDFFVLETKSFKASSVHVSRDGSFTIKDSSGVRAIESPIAQNDRHIMVLKRILKKYEILPKRITEPSFHNYVLFHPKTLIDLTDLNVVDRSHILKSDLFYLEIEKYRNDNAIIKSIMRLVTPKSLEGIGREIMQYHKPLRPDYRKKFGISNSEIMPGNHHIATSEAHTLIHRCDKCQRVLTESVVDYCHRNKVRFKGKTYCMQHQKEFDK